jgi:DNA replication and repair protein RecF
MDRSGFNLTDLREGFLQRLADLRPEEIARGVTTTGPHRDELRFLSNGVDLGEYGSRGQLRTALLSLKMAEARWMKDRTGEFPILLLDEILAELDDRRRADLLNTLDDFEQSVLTTTDLKLFAPSFLSRCTLWHVSQGVVQAEQPSASL